MGDGILTHDEALKFIAARDYGEGKFYSDIDHPALQKYLIWISITIFGNGEWAIRLPNAILGVVTIVLVYLIGKHMFSSWTGALAALLLATNPLHIGYSTYAKEDALLTFFLTLAIYVYLKKEKSIGNERIKYTSIILGFALASKFTALCYPLIFAATWFWEKHDETVNGAAKGGKRSFKERIFAFYHLIVEFKKRIVYMYGIMVVTLIVLTPWIIIYLPFFVHGGLGHWAASETEIHSTTLLDREFNQTPLGYYLPLFIFNIPLSQFVLLVLACLSFHAYWKNEAGGRSNSSHDIFINGQGEDIPAKRYDKLIIAWLLIPLIVYSALSFAVLRFSVAFMPPLVLFCARGVNLMYRFFITSDGFWNVASTRIIFLLFTTALVLTSALSSYNASPDYREYKNEFADIAGIDEVYGIKEKTMHPEKTMLKFMSQQVQNGDNISSDIDGPILDYYLNTSFYELVEEKWNGFTVWEPRKRIMDRDIYVEDKNEMLSTMKWVIIHETTLYVNCTASMHLREYLDQLKDKDSIPPNGKDFQCKLLKEIPCENSLFAFEILNDEVTD